MTDAYGNKILATVNGWKITSGDFLFVLSKPGRAIEVCRGSLESAKAMAQRDCKR